MRVLHTIGKFLPITENWIYPQVARVPGVESAMLCDDVVNLQEFSLDPSRLFVRRSFAADHIVGRSIPARAARRILNGAARFTALRRARAWKPAVLHAHFGMHGWASLRLKELLGVPLITSFYGYDAWSVPKSNPEWGERFRQLFDQGDIFLVEGRAFRQRLVELGCAREKIRIHRLGTDISGLDCRQREFTGRLRIAMVGRFVEKKGLVDGLSACASAAASGVDLNVTIIGDDLKDDIRGQHIKQQLLSIAELPAMAGRVFFKGFLPTRKAMQALAEQDILLCPSRHAANGDAEGGLPVVLIEAMAMGLLSVGSRHCDIPEAIIHEKTGYLFEEGNVGELSSILRDLSRAPEGLKAMAQAGRKHVEDRYALKEQTVRLREIYRSVGV